MSKTVARKRVLVAGIVAVLALTAALMAGCSQGAGQGSDQGQQAAQQNGSSADATAQDSSQAVTLSVRVSPSLEKPLEEAQDAYQQAHPNVTFDDSTFKAENEAGELASSGAADIVAMDSKAQMDAAQADGLVDAATRFDLAADELVIVVPSDDDATKELALADLATGDYVVAVADGSTATGALTDEALASVGCFLPLAAAGSSAPSTTSAASSEAGEAPSNSASEPSSASESASAGASEASASNAASNVSAASDEGFAGTPIADAVQVEASSDEVCRAVSSGQAEAGIVRATDVYRVGGVKAVGTVPVDSYTRILYPVAVGASSANATEAQAFLDWCATDSDAQEIWQKWGLSSAL